LLRSASHAGRQRAEALKQMLDAQRRLTDLRTRRNEREESLGALAARLHFDDVTQLLREHGEHVRLTAESQRLGWVDQDRKRATLAEHESLAAVQRWAERAGLAMGQEPYAVLARLRQGIGAVLEVRARQRDLA